MKKIALPVATLAMVFALAACTTVVKDATPPATTPAAETPAAETPDVVAPTTPAAETPAAETPAK